MPYIKSGNLRISIRFFVLYEVRLNMYSKRVPLVMFSCHGTRHKKSKWSIFFGLTVFIIIDDALKESLRRCFYFLRKFKSKKKQLQPPN